MALNQLLVVMDGIDNPPWMQRTFTSKLNTLLDATFIVPRSIGKVKLRHAGGAPAQRPDLLHRRHQRPDRPARPRPDPPGTHGPARVVPDADASRTASTSSTSTSARSRTARSSTRPTRRDEIARIMSGYSPAMIEQAISMALTIAHHTGSTGFGWDDLVEAVTTLDAGTAIGSEYIPMERRAVAIHEAGHAVAGHVYLTGRESTRLTIKKRGDQGVGGPPLDDREGGAPLLVPARDVPRHRLGPRRDGGGAGRLRRELERRRRRRRRRHGARGPDGRPRGDGAAAVPRHAAKRRDRGAGAQGGARPLREDRAADHVAGGRRRAVRRRPDRRRARRSGEADGRGADPRPGLRDGAQPRDRRTAPASRRSRTHSRTGGRSWATSCCACSSRAEITIPELDLADESVWPPLEFSAAIGRGPQPPGPPPSDGDPDVSESDRTEPAERRAGASSRRSRPSRSARPERPLAPTAPAAPPIARGSRSSTSRSALVAGIGVGAFVVLVQPLRPAAAARSGRRGSRRAATRPRPGRSPTRWRRATACESGQQLVAALVEPAEGDRRGRRRAREHDRDPPRHLDREEGGERDRRPADDAQPAVHPLRARHGLLDQGRHRLGGAPRAPSPRGARARPLHVQVRRRGRLGLGLPSTAA